MQKTNVGTVVFRRLCILRT